ncbi:NAD-dependent epimerase/dehydratase family protein [Companilactobacillus sp. HBUAS56275]|uniref:NAD-dependent epimerase/dehydratase family protein n=1 Tax=Companilactobacillus sp. HBUAS56275 TaxID=3109364 RepID=UPI002FF241FE
MEKVLVTGGTGFLGLRLVMQLLNDGYDVRTTIRKRSGQDRIMRILKEYGTKNIQNISFIEADLSSDDNWLEAMQDRKYVFSVASPVFFGKIKNESDAIKPALDGTLRILKAANKSNVKRVVMTSNFGAVGFSKKSGITTENDWTDPDEKGLSIYEKSKLLAEQAAWQYIGQPDVNLEFVTANPTAIFGPSLDQHVSGSFDLLKNILNAKMGKIPNLPLNVVDVRDVVDIEIKAMTTPGANLKRFIASADGQISIREIADLIRSQRNSLSTQVTDKLIPNWIVELGSLFNSRAREGKLMLHINRKISNQQAKDILGWTPVSDNQQAVLAAVDSLLKYKLV